jgi:SAM-dependent methyltransferase
MRNVSCNICGSSDHEVVFEKGRGIAHRVVRCRQCSLMFANPQEIIDCEEFLAPNGAPDLDLEGKGRQYFQKQQVQLPDNLRALAVLNALVPQKGRLLEIGSFLGIFLDRIRADGWDATGLEPYRWPADYARKKYGLNIVDGVLPNRSLPDGGFDAVMMLHVIEHMPDPSADVRELRRVLRKGGIMVVETPRFDSLMFKLMGRRERSLNNCPGHIYFFTVQTLSKLVEKCGFEVARVELVGRTLTVDRLLTNLGIMSQSRRVTGWLGRMGPKLGLDRVRIHVNARDMQRIYFRAT